MSFNWPIITGVLTSAGVLGGGAIGIAADALFHRNEKRATTDSVNIDASIKLLRECMAAKQQLRKEYNALRRHNDKCDHKLGDTQRQLRDAHDALRLVTGLPILQQAGQDDKIEELITALEAVRKIIDKP